MYYFIVYTELGAESVHNNELQLVRKIRARVKKAGYTVSKIMMAEVTK